MKTYVKKVSKTLLISLAILLILSAIYLVIPKYQIHSVRVDEDYVLVTKINTLTGEISNKLERYTPSPKISKIKVIE